MGQFWHTGALGMTEVEWLNGANPWLVLHYLRDHGSERKARLFACGCARRVWHLLPDGPLRRGVEIVEAYADGACSEQDRSLALRAAVEALILLAAAGDVAVQADPTFDPVTGGWQGRQAFGGEVAAFAEYIDRAYDDALFDQEAAGIPTDPCPVLARSDAVTVAYLAAFRDLHGSYESWANLCLLTEIAAQAITMSAAPRGYVAVLDVEADPAEEIAQAHLGRDLLGNPFRPATIDPAWLSWNGETVVRLARMIYEELVFADLPVLADALEEAGCTDTAMLDHCRSGGEHVRGCWVIDLLLGKH
jgi:hypothetical protein